MGFKEQYEKGKIKLLTDKTICKENRNLFKKFFEYEEYKLKRMNGINNLDNKTYKTLCFYLSRLRTVNRWFKNKAWKNLIKEDIKKVYDDLEDGKIKNKFGKPYTTNTFYNTVWRSKPFELAGKKEIAEEVMEFYFDKPREEVRFIKEETFRQLIRVTRSHIHKTFLWLCWDIGENSDSLIQLQKKDCVRQIDSNTKEPEYYINLRKNILKRSRRARTEITNYKETVELLDLLLKDKKENDLIFGFGYRMAYKILENAVKKTGIVCIPGGQNVTLKDLRSSMACDLLSKGFSRDEVNSRLGHVPSSREIDKYINYLAIDRGKTKKKFYDSNLQEIKHELEKAKQRDKMNGQRLERQQGEIEKLKKAILKFILEKGLGKELMELRNNI